jgi:ABC-type transporter Mla MlaB component
VAKTSKAAEAVKTLKLARDLRIAGAAAAYGALREVAEAQDRRVALDARQVEKVDAAGLQALLAGRRLLTEAGKTVTWTGCSAQLKSAAELLGLAEPLGLAR